MDIIGFNNRPAGENFVIAIMSYEGYNIEDALIIEQGVYRAALAWSMFFRTYDAEDWQYPGGKKTALRYLNGASVGTVPRKRTGTLPKTALFEPETSVEGGDVLIGRTLPPRFIEEYKEFDSLYAPMRRETSVNMRHGEWGIVDTIIITETVDGNKLVKIKVRDLRCPNWAKFASRHGQKGVIGLIQPQEDMPFGDNGLVPDLVINPHAFPSRMTLAQMFEPIFSRNRVKQGAPFGMLPRLRRKICLTSSRNYWIAGSRTCWHPLDDGITGEMYPVGIFIGRRLLPETPPPRS